MEKILTDPKDILDHIYSYYKNLYSSQLVDENKAREWVNQLKEQNLIPQLSREHVEYLEQDIDK